MNAKNIFVALFLICAVLIILPSPGASEEPKFPDRAVTVLVPFPPGGGADTAARIVGNIIEKYIYQPFTVVNKTGGAGLVAGDFLVKSKPDGYTIASLTSPAWDPELYTYFRKPTYKYTDLVPIARLMFDAYGLICKSGAPWRNLNELISYAKANPKKLSWGHQGLGHPYHLRGASLARDNGLEMNDVPFLGSGPTTLAVLGGKLM